MSQPQSSLETKICRLELRHTWTTTMAASNWRETLFVHFCRDGIEGMGEGAPILTYQESAASAAQAVASVREQILDANPMQFAKIRAQINRDLKGEWAAKSAMDLALYDWMGKRLGIPLYEHFGLDPEDAPVTSYSIGIDEPEIVRQKVREAEGFAVLKVKVGLDSDEQMIAAVRSMTDRPLRVDANQGWTHREEAARKLDWLADQNVEFVEQPMPVAETDEQREDMRWLYERASLPLIADESCRHPEDIPQLVGLFHGVNIKLDKAGGLGTAHEMLLMGQSLGFKTMIGCMVSSSCAITAAAHLSPLADYADLDGNLLIANDPYRGVTIHDGRLKLPARPGLGLIPA